VAIEYAGDDRIPAFAGMTIKEKSEQKGWPTANAIPLTSRGEAIPG
jgi:hypothetical protein